MSRALALAFVFAAASGFGPWSWKAPGDDRGTGAPPAAPQGVRTAADERGSDTFYLPYKLYQRTLSAMDGPTCGHYPTCSAYAVLALRKHGPVLGLMLTISRLTAPAPLSSAVRRNPRVLLGEQVRFHDPVEAADFWFRQ